MAEYEINMENDHDWYVYIVSCADCTLYTGIAKDLEKRIMAHNSEKGGAKYTRFRQPITLLYFEGVESRSAATKRESQIKKLPLKKKIALINDEPSVIEKKGLFRPSPTL